MSTILPVREPSTDRVAATIANSSFKTPATALAVVGLVGIPKRTLVLLPR